MTATQTNVGRFDIAGKGSMIMSWRDQEPSQPENPSPETTSEPASEPVMPEPPSDYDFGDYTKTFPLPTIEPEE